MYCTIEDINNLLSDISDDATTETLNTVLENTTAWIDSNLRRNYLPIPTNNPQALKTASIYYGASDILLTLYHGEELPIEFDVWFNKAETILQDYIEAELNNTTDSSINNKIRKVTSRKRPAYKRYL